MSSVQNKGINISIRDISVTISQNAINEAINFRNKSIDVETGGILYGIDYFKNKTFSIEKLSGPRLRDIRKKNLFIPHRKSVQSEIEEMHEKGWHYMGEWHTHDSENAVASNEDISTMRKLYKESKHLLPFFILVIVGKSDDCKNYSIIAINDKDTVVLI